MVECQLCKLKYNSYNGLAKHIQNSHNIKTYEYYKEYINPDSKFLCECGNNLKFYGFKNGFAKNCSKDCRQKYGFYSSPWKGKKQSKETIEKRIKNTDQLQKQKTLESTMFKRYGVKNPYSLPSVIENKLNCERTYKRSSEHSKKIIESKRKNGTLKHKKETKKKISKTINELYQSDSAPITISENNNKKHIHGYFNSIYYRSSYELQFLQYCFENDIEIFSAENKKYRVKYFVNNKQHFYYPDFYLPKFNLIVEIKPKSMLTYNNNSIKIENAINLYKDSYKLITETELSDLEKFFEHILCIA